MNPSGLILATALVVVCWTTTVSSRSLDVASENNDLDSLNIPAELEFEAGDGDVGGVRDKRTPRFIFRTVSCLFTFLINPSCLQSITGGGSGGSGGGSSLGSSSSSNSNRRQQSQPYYMISLPRYNDTDNGTSTEYPIYPIESTSEYPEEPPPSRPTNPILAMLQWKMNLIPNIIRRFLPGIGGGRRDDGGSGGGSPFSFNLGSLGLGGGRLAGLFGGGNRGGGGGGGFGGLGLGGGLGGGGGGGGFGGQY